MIKRKALLIGAPGGINSKYLPGVFVDLTMTKEFLMSPQGGAWLENEIIVLYDPSIEDIAAALIKMNADYTITLFSGHGFADNIGNRFLQLSDDNYFQDKELLNNSNKQLVLIDSCRKVIPSIGIGDPGKEKWSHFEGQPIDDLHKARKIYDAWILRSQPGQVIIHSTRHNKYAYDTKNGGVFMSKLLGLAGNVQPTNEKTTCMSVYAAGETVYKQMQNSIYSQRPKITYKNGNIDLPFALGLPKAQFIQHYEKAIKRNNNAGWVLFFVAVCLLSK